MKGTPPVLLVASLAASVMACSFNAQDAHSDLDCAVITGSFLRGAEQQEAPVMQQAAFTLVAKWYSAEINRTGQVNSPEFTEEYVQAVTDKLNADMAGANRKLNACLDRAIANPRFEPFAQAAGWTGRLE